MISDRAKRLVEAVLATKDHYEAEEIAQKFLDDEAEESTKHAHECHQIDSLRDD